MFRTIKVKLAGNTKLLFKTAQLYTQACQIALDYGFKNKTYDKNRIDEGTYKTIREQICRNCRQGWCNVQETKPPTC